MNATTDTKPSVSKIESVLAKVARLRALAAHAGTQAEMETAAAMAERLIVEYQIEESQLEGAGNEPPETSEDAGILHDYEGRADAWVGALASGLARFHGCFSFQNKTSQGATQRIAGRPSDVKLVRYLFAWLRFEIDRLAAREQGRSARNAFRHGAVAGYLAAIKNQQEATVAVTPTKGASFGLVLADRTNLAKQVFTRQGLRFHTTHSHSSDLGAFGRGRAAGGNLMPHAGLGVGSRPLLGR